MRISDWSSDVCSSDLFSLSVPEAGVRTNVVGAPLESMASELRAELGSGPWLLFGKDSDGAPLRPRVLDDKQIAGGDHGLAATTSLQPNELRADVQASLLHRPRSDNRRVGQGCDRTCRT